jgi:hypothetical protein
MGARHTHRQADEIRNEEKNSLFWGVPRGTRGAARDWLGQSPALSPKARQFLFSFLRISGKVGSDRVVDTHQWSREVRFYKIFFGLRHGM